MTTQKSKEETLAQMDADAKVAKDEFFKMTSSSEVDYGDSVRNLAAWWEHWYRKAGHKRLAYILMGKKLNGE